MFQCNTIALHLQITIPAVGFIAHHRRRGVIDLIDGSFAVEPFAGQHKLIIAVRVPFQFHQAVIRIGISRKCFVTSEDILARTTPDAAISIALTVFDFRRTDMAERTEHFEITSLCCSGNLLAEAVVIGVIAKLDLSAPCSVTFENIVGINRAEGNNAAQCIGT